VTIRTSFSEPYGLNTPSSSSFVTVIGKPEQKKDVLLSLYIKINVRRRHLAA
jgi:hypothetical protein